MEPVLKMKLWLQPVRFCSSEIGKGEEKENRKLFKGSEGMKSNEERFIITRRKESTSTGILALIIDKWTSSQRVFIHVYSSQSVFYKSSLVTKEMRKASQPTTLTDCPKRLVSDLTLLSLNASTSKSILKSRSPERCSQLASERKSWGCRIFVRRKSLLSQIEYSFLFFRFSYKIISELTTLAISQPLSVSLSSR